MNFSSELLNKGNKTPAFSISIEGRDITTVLDNRLMGLTLTDNRGFEADQLDLELDDADGKIVLPRRGAVITLALGWKGQPLFPKGAFTVDEIEHTGAPDRLTIRARSADFRETLNTREPAKKESTTVKRKRRTKKQKKEPEAKQGDYLVGTDENVLVLNRTYANRSNAERAAKMQWERLQRGVASFSLQLAEGRADLYTEMPVKVSGFKQPIDDAEWTITTLTHTVSPDNGFTTSLELEVRIDDFEME
ncbi:regulator of late gene expression [Escherichia coli]|uniref:contractile injection system protein, VgrG/Pvc8 family n=1 Tax=Escherichia coli TaxID=562 RepID=UPI0006C483E1|nr:contractile injection system protein, VgrG/Pvc8 family [Escherichia coli]CTX93828.1 regulator of late gene expression [Escherichia coli]